MLRRPYWPRVRLAVEWAAAWALFGGVFVGLHAVEPRWPGVVHALYGVALLVGLVLVSEASGASRRRAARAIQAHRDRDADALHRAIARRDERAPYPERLRGSYDLYLRPFQSTAHVKVVVRSWVQRRRALDPDLIGSVEITGWGRSSTHRRYVVWGDLETFVAEQLERSGRRLVALGMPGEQVGAGRLPSSEEVWRQDVRALADGARALIVLPSMAAGTAWEIDHVLAHPELLRKTVFVVPPAPTLFGPPASLGAWSDLGAARARSAGTIRRALETPARDRHDAADSAAAARDPDFGDDEASGPLHARAVEALRAHGIALSRVPAEGAAFAVGPDRVPGRCHALVRYEPDVLQLPNPARFQPVRVRLTGLAEALADLEASARPALPPPAPGPIIRTPSTH